MWNGAFNFAAVWAHPVLTSMHTLHDLTDPNAGGMVGQLQH